MSTDSDSELSSLAKEIRGRAEYLKSGLLPGSASLLDNLANEVYPLKSITNTNQKYDKLEKDIRSEFSQGNSVSEALFDQVWNHLPVPPATAPMKLADMHLLDGTLEADKQIAQLNQVFTSLGVTKEQKFYGMCLVYLILMEGVYDQALRDLLLWNQNCRGTISNVQDMKIYKVKEELEENIGCDPILFQGWQPRVRNSIAHARFSYDERTDHAVFEDVDPRNPANTFRAEMSYEELGQLVMSLYFVVYLLRIALVVRYYVRPILVKAEQLLNSASK